MLPFFDILYFQYDVDLSDRHTNRCHLVTNRRQTIKARDGSDEYLQLPKLYHTPSMSQAKKAPEDLQEGDTVSWNWGTSHPKGNVKAVYEEEASIKSKNGNKVSHRLQA